MKKLSAPSLAWLRPGICVFLLFSSLLAANGQVYLSAQTQGGGNVGDAVSASVSVAGFNSILSAQFSVVWNPAVLTFTGVDGFGIPSVTATNFNTSGGAQGYVNFAWYDQNFVGATLPDCSGLFTLHFTRLAVGPGGVSISDTPLGIEIGNIDGTLETIPNAGPCTASSLSGKIFHDASGDCTLNNGEAGLSGWHLSLTNGINTFSTTTTTNGSYGFEVAAGDYELSALAPNGLWSPCQANYAVQVAGGSTTQDVPAKAILDCPLMEVQLAVPSLRPCFDKVYQVKYCNNGTMPAVGASVQVTFDPYMTVLVADIAWSDVIDNTYTFPLGTVGVGECGNFGVKINLSCGATVGLAHCVEAHVFPDASCFPADPAWDGAQLKVTGACNGGQVQFTILNEGASMASPTWYNVITDGNLTVFNEPLELSSGATLALDFPDNGATYRVEAQQSAHHPWSVLPSATVEACGPGPDFSLGYYTQYAQDDGAPFLDIDCRESTNSFDPNDKQGFPKGFCGNFVSPGTDMEYTIRFQNTGTDTAYEVVLLDTIPSALEAFSIRPGASSHPYSFSLENDGVAEFKFTNIDLPNVGANAEGSQGFVQYRIAQRPGNADGTGFENRAAIYFDLNAPIITNAVQNTVLAEQLHLSSPTIVTNAGTATSNDGSIEVGGMSGGVPPYATALNGQAGGPSFNNLSPGEYELQVTDASGCQFSETYLVSIETAAGEATEQGKVAQLQPNLVAAGGVFDLVFPAALPAALKVRVTDMAGQVVATSSMELPLGNGVLKMDAPKRGGVYFVEVVAGNHIRQVLRLVVI